jgi:hypothetical protein
MKVWAVRNMGLFLFFIYYNIYYKFCPSLYGMVGLGRVGRYKGGVLALEVGRSLVTNRCIYTQSLLRIGRVCGMGGLVRTN